MTAIPPVLLNRSQSNLAQVWAPILRSYSCADPKFFQFVLLLDSDSARRYSVVSVGFRPRVQLGEFRRFHRAEWNRLYHLSCPTSEGPVRVVLGRLETFDAVAELAS